MISLVPVMGAVMDYMVETCVNTVRRVQRRHEQRRLLRLARVLMEQCHEQRDMIDNLTWVPVNQLPAVYETMCQADEKCDHWYSQLCFLAFLDRRYKLSTQQWNDIWDLLLSNQQFKDLIHLIR